MIRLFKAREKASTFIEALPYIQKYYGKIVVIKYGGNAMIDEELKKSVLKDIVLLKYVGLKPVVVHGGGPFINERMAHKGIHPKFVDGLRVTDEQTIEIVKEVLYDINKEIVSIIKENGGKAKGLVGDENYLIEVKQKDKKLGYVGEVKRVDVDIMLSLLHDDFIPVIAPLGVCEGKTYNVNADTVATAIAIALKAEKLTIMTNVKGVIEKKQLIPHLTIEDAEEKIKQNIITGGMIPKVQACMEAVKHGVGKAHLIDGTIKHSLFLEIFTEKGVGTEIVKKNGEK